MDEDDFKVLAAEVIEYVYDGVVIRAYHEYPFVLHRNTPVGEVATNKKFSFKRFNHMDVLHGVYYRKENQVICSPDLLLALQAYIEQYEKDHVFTHHIGAAIGGNLRPIRRRIGPV